MPKPFSRKQIGILSLAILAVGVLAGGWYWFTQSRPVITANFSVEKVVAAEEAPTFTVANVPVAAEAVTATLSSDGREFAVAPVIEQVGDELKVSIPPVRQFKPGKYQLSISYDRGRGLEVVTQDFSWGVLAFNVYQSPHSVGDTVAMGMAVLDDLGITLCDATVVLEVQKPNGDVVTPAVTRSEICADKYVTDIPDYSASLVAEEAGTYQVQLTAQTKNGERSLRDSFEVVERAETVISRATSMRIYPVANYQVALTVTAGQSGAQKLTELVPNRFAVTIGQGGMAQQVSSDLQEITWNLELQAGESKTVTYAYDAPNITPQFYLLGPASFGSIKEQRAWQIASDEVGSASSNRLWSSGAELNSLTADMEITASSGTTPTISSSTKRSGDYAFRTNTSSNTATIYKTFASTAQADAFWFRAYVRIASAPGVEMGFLRIGTGTNNKIGVRMNTDRSIELWNEEDSAQIGSASSALALDTWYRVEVFVDTTTLSSTDATLKLDGVTVASSTAENLAAGVDRLTWGNLTSTTADLYFDDIAINGDTGRSDNWAGEGKIVHMHGNADGDNEAWTGSPNNTDDYDDINEVTPSDGSGGGIFSATSGQITEMNLESASSAGITAGDAVKLVSVGARMEVCGTSTFGWSGFPPMGCPPAEVLISYRTRIKASTGGTVEDSGDISVPDTTSGWFTNDDGLRLPKLTLYDLPGTSTAKWTTSNLDDAQIGVTHSSTGFGFKSTAVWLLVEYTPASGGRLYSSGFELNSTTADMEWTSVTGSPTIQTTTKNSGAYAFQSASGGAQSFMTQVFASSNTNGPIFVRGYFRIETATNQESSIMELRDSGGTRRAYIAVRNTGALRLYDEDGQIGSDSSALSTATWYRIELKFNTVPSAGSHEVEARIDGSSFASSTTRNISTGIDRLAIGNNIANGGPNFAGQNQWDDIAINQGIGTVQNSWPGAGSIIHLTPNAAGDNSAWTGSYTDIDDTTPPNDASDSISETTSGDIFDTNLSDSSLSSEVITLVSVGARFRTSSATEEQFRLRLKDAANGNTIESPILAPASTAWRTHTTAAPYLSTLTAYTRPEQDSAWTDTQLDAAQIGVRNISGSGTVEVTSMWLLVEYQPVSLITVSGTIYSDEGVTAYNCSSDNLTIGVSVNGGTAATTTCTAAGGTYSVTVAANPSAAGDPISVWIDSAETPKATVVTRAADTTSNLTGINLYQNRLIVRHEDSGPITNANLATADNANAGIRYSVSSGNLTVESGISLYVWGSKTFTPGGTVTTNTTGGDIKINTSGVFSPGSNAVSIGGSWENSGTFTAGTSTVTFTSTSGGRTLSGTLTGASAFYNIVFNGVSGAWGFSAAVAATNDFTVTNGAVTANSNNLTVGRDFILDNNSGVAYTPGTSTVSFTRHFTDTGDKFVEGTTSTVTHTGTGTITTANGFDFRNLNVGASTFTTTFSNNNTDVLGTLTFNGGTVTGSGSYFSVSCSVTCTPVVFNSPTTLNGTRTIYYLSTVGGITVTMAGGNYGNWTIVTYAATGNSSTFQLGGNFTTSSDLRLEATNGLTGSSFTTTGSNYSITAARFYIAPCAPTRTGSWAVSFNDSVVSLTNQAVASINVESNCGTHTLDLGSSDVTVSGNVVLVNGTGTIAITPGTSDFRFAPPNATTKTFTPNGQSLHNVFIQALGSTGTVLLAGAMDVNNDLTISAGVLDVASGGNHSVTIGGSYSNSGTFEARSGTVTFDATTTGKTLSGTLTYGNGDFNNLTFNGVGGEWSINGSLATAGALTVTNGTIIGSNNVRTSGGLTGAGTINMSGGTFTVDGGGGTRDFGTTSGSANWTFNNLTIHANGGFPVTFNTQTGGSGSITVTGILRVGNSGDTNVTTLDAGNRNWILSGTGGDPFQMLTSPTAVLTASTSTFTYSGNNASGNTTVQSATYYNVVINNASETFVFEAATAASNDFTVTNGNMTANNFNLTVTRDFTLANTSGVAYTAGSSTLTVTRNFTDTGAKFVMGTSTVLLNGTGTLDALATSFNNLSIAYSTFTTTLASQYFDVYGNLTFNGGTAYSSFDSGGAWLNVRRATSGTSIVFAAATALTNLSTPRQLLMRSTVGSITLSWPAGNYGDWLIGSFGNFNNTTWELQGNVTTTNTMFFESTTGVTGSSFVTNNYSITASAINFGSNPLARNGSWSASFGSSVITLSDTSNSLRVLSDSGSHSIDMGSSQISAAGSVLFANGTGSITLTPGTSTLTLAPASGTKSLHPNSQSLYNLVVNGAGTVQLEGVLDVDNNLTITAGTLDTKSGGNFAITVGGNWTNGGTFTARSGTVTFNDASKTSNISGSTTFHNLTSTTPLKQLKFSSYSVASNVFQVNGALTLTGTAGNEVELSSSNSGQQWRINHQGTESVSHTKVLDSGCDGASTGISLNSTAIDQGNNGACWLFSFVISGTVYDSDRVTPIDFGPTVRVKVNGTGTYSASADINGVYTIDNVPLVDNDSVIAYLDTGGGIRGETVTKVAAGALSLDVYRNRTTFQCDITPVCVLYPNEVSYYDTDNDPDIFFDYDGGLETLTIPSASTFSLRGEFYFWNGNLTFMEVEGDMEILAGGRFSNTDSNLSIYGSYSNAGEYVTDGEQVYFKATTTGKTISGTLTGSTGRMDSVHFDGVGGGWTYSNAAEVGQLFLTNGTLTAPSSTLTIGGNLSRTSGAFTHNSGTVVLNDSGSATITGAFTGSNALHKLQIAGGGSTTITAEDSLELAASNATDALSLTGGTFTFGNSNGDTLTLRGGVQIATTADQTATFQTGSVTQGSTITVDLNLNTSTPSCANCIIKVGATSGNGTGTFRVQKNSLVRLNPRRTATVSDSGIEVESTGYLEVKGSLDVDAATLTATDTLALRETTLCAAQTYSNDQHNGKAVRMKTGLASGYIYPVVDTIADDANCTTNTHDSITIASTASAIETNTTVSGSGPTRTVVFLTEGIVNSDMEHVGRYLHNLTTDTYYRIIRSSLAGLSVTVIAEPDSFASLTTGDDIQITDGIRPGDTYDVIDHAAITAESGLTCNTAHDGSAGAYIHAKADSQTLLEYARICNLGSSNTNKFGATFSGVDGAVSNEGVVVRYAHFTENRIGIFLDGSANNTISYSNIDSNVVDDLGLQIGTGSSGNTISSTLMSGGSNKILAQGTSDQITNNVFIGDASISVELNSAVATTLSGNTFARNSAGVDSVNSSASVITGNSFYGMNTNGISIDSSMGEIISSNTVAGVSGTGILVGGTTPSNSYLANNDIYANTQHGVHVTRAANLVGNIIRYNTSAGIFVDGAATSPVNLSENEIYGNVTGLSIDGSGTHAVNLTNEIYGQTVANSSRDILFSGGSGHYQLKAYNTTLASGTEVSAASYTNQSYLISRKHNGVDGITWLWGNYEVPADDAATSQNESAEVYPYDAPTYPSQATSGHVFADAVGGSASTDTNLDLTVPDSTLGGTAGSYLYHIVCTAANCVSTPNSWVVYRNGVQLSATANTGERYADTQSDGGTAPNVQFKIEDAGGDYTRGASYAFQVVRSSDDAEIAKTIQHQEAAARRLTIPSGHSLELRGSEYGVTTIEPPGTADPNSFRIYVDGLLTGEYADVTVVGGFSGEGVVSMPINSAVTSYGGRLGSTSGPDIWDFDNLTLRNNAIGTKIVVIEAGTSLLKVNGTLTIGDPADPGIRTELRNSSANIPIDAHSVVISSKGRITASASASFTVSGNWTNAGTFTASDGTVTFDGTGTSTLTGPTTFANLTITTPVTAPRTVQFSSTGGHIIGVTGLFTARGGTGRLINLVSTSGGNQWHFYPTGTYNLSQLYVQDGGCESGAISMTVNNSNDGGNNDSCWVFGTTEPTTNVRVESGTVRVESGGVRIQ